MIAKTPDDMGATLLHNWSTPPLPALSVVECLSCVAKSKHTPGSRSARRSPGVAVVQLAEMRVGKNFAVGAKRLFEYLPAMSDKEE